VRDYELGIVVSPDATEEQTRGIIDRVVQTVAAGGGQVLRVNAWGRRRLAYPINHHRDGYYVFMDMVMNPQGVAEVEHNLRVSEEVIRHILVRRDPRAVAAARTQEMETVVDESAPPAEASEEEELSPVSEIEVEIAPDAELEE